MTPTWKGTPILKTCFDPKRDEYHLLDDNNDIVDTLSRPAFLSQPQLKRLPNGRYRRTHTAHNRSPANLPSLAGGVDPGADDDTYVTWRGVPIGPGGITRVGTGLPVATWRMLTHEVALKPPLKREGIIPGEIIGYRCWRIEDGLLRSVYQTDVWAPRAVLEGRELGDWDSRGIHAWKDPASKHYHDYIRSYLNPNDDPFYSMILLGSSKARNDRPAMATGTVFLWGDVVEHERGYRAEFARVRSLDWLYPDADMMGREAIVLADLRRTYDV